MSDLMIFEGKNVEVFELNGRVLFNPYHVGACLELMPVSVRRCMQKMNKNQVVKLTKSIVHNVNNLEIPTAGRNYLTESGVYKLIFKSRKPSAEKFADWVTDEVLPSIRKEGRYEISTIPNTPPLKTYHNTPVLTTADLCRIFGVSRWVIYQEVKAWKVENVNLQHFLKENPNLPNTGGKAYNLYFKQFVMDYAAKKGVSQEVLEMLEHYFNQKRERPAYMDIELFRKVRTLELFYHSGKMFFIDKEFAEDFTRLVSKKFKDLGLMEEGVSDPMDLSIHNAPGWNLRGTLLEFYRSYR